MATPVSNPRDVSRTSLPNGIRIITESVPHVRSASIGVWIGTGARRETPKQNGISHFIEHMLFKGSTQRSAEQIAREADATGGNLDAYTAKELVSYNIKVLDEHLPIAFDLVSDLVLHPRFDTEDIEKEKGVILEELKMEVDNPEYLVHETFFTKFWRNHALGRSILGTKATIRSFDQAMVRSYYEDVYCSSNIVITAAGRISHSRIVEWRTLTSAIFPRANLSPPNRVHNPRRR
jgi:predicted Zn-dependent peptidase